MVAMGRLTGSEGGRGDQTDVGGEKDEGHEAEDRSTLAGLSWEEKIDEARKNASARSGGSEVREVGTQGMRHAGL